MKNLKYNDNELSVYSGIMVLTFIFLFIIVAFLAFLNDKFIYGFLCIPFVIFSLSGFFIVAPNTAKVAIFLGEYSGTIKDSGFFWANPLLSLKEVSLKTMNINTPVMKVNDSRGNPIEIAAIIVWEINSPVNSILSVENCGSYVKLQAESAIRQVANEYSYDGQEDKSLRKNTNEISEILRKTIQEHVVQSGVNIIEAKISHLAYSQEIASIMLKKQQAQAIVDARMILVQGTVSIVENALQQLKEDNIVTFTEVQKSQLVINLMTVLVGDTPVQPTIQMNTD